MRLWGRISSYQPPSFLWLLVVLGALWLRESLPQGLPPWSHRPLPHVIPLGLYVLSPLRILVTGFRAHLVNPGWSQDPSLIIAANPPFPNKSRSWTLGFGLGHIFFGEGDTVQPTVPFSCCLNSLNPLFIGTFSFLTLFPYCKLCLLTLFSFWEKH